MFVLLSQTATEAEAEEAPKKQQEQQRHRSVVAAAGIPSGTPAKTQPKAVLVTPEELAVKSSQRSKVATASLKLEHEEEVRRARRRELGQRYILLHSTPPTPKPTKTHTSALSFIQEEIESAAATGGGTSTAALKCVVLLAATALLAFTAGPSAIQKLAGAVDLSDALPV